MEKRTKLRKILTHRISMSKKTLFSLFLFALPLVAFGGTRGTWRGFIEANSGGSHFNKPYPEHNETWDMVCGMNFTGGLQISPNWFCGVGVGCYTAFWVPDTEFYAIYIPVYGDIRWTPILGKRVCPFMDVKLGYQFGGPVDQHSATYVNGVYCQPSVGIRLGRATGFNIGIGYNVFHGRKYYEPWREGFLGEFNKGEILLILGVDF